MPNPLILVQNSFLGGFAPFRRRTQPIAETIIIARKQQTVLEAETTRNMSFGPTVVDWACSL